MVPLNRETTDADENKLHTGILTDGLTQYGEKPERVDGSLAI